jgi:4,5-DOPA dioxygenase extradiol
MDRRDFLSTLSLAAIGTNMQLHQFHKLASELPDTEKMPVLFVGHGNPMNAIEKNEFSNKWAEIGKSLSTPKAILVVSAHWQTSGTKVTAMEMPETIHDFGGFPQELFDAQYKAPGSPEFAKQTQELVKKTTVTLNYDWGLDHGCWSVLMPMFPDAKIPVFQFSLDYTQQPAYHYALAQELKALRNRGVLVMGSGNIVHNLGMVQWGETAYDWAIEFDEKIKELILSGDHTSIINYTQLGKAAQLSVPTNEHYLPLLYTLALQDKTDTLSFFNEKATMGSISMRGVRLT